MRLLDLPATTKDGDHHVVVESPRGSAVKLKYDANLQAFKLSRPLPVGLAYPFDWGFVPGTQGPDGDPIDAMLVSDFAIPTGTVVPCHLIGVLEVEQNDGHGGRERNDRVIGVPTTAARIELLQHVDQLPARFRDELARFFVDVTHFEKKAVEILGWRSPEAARALITRAVHG